MSEDEFTKEVDFLMKELMVPKEERFSVEKLVRTLKKVRIRIWQVRTFSTGHLLPTYEILRICARDGNMSMEGIRDQYSIHGYSDKRGVDRLESFVRIGIISLSPNNGAKWIMKDE